MNKAERRKKVARAIAALIQAGDVDKLSDIKPFDSLDREDQQDAKFLARHAIDLYDGLTGKDES